MTLLAAALTQARSARFRARKVLRVRVPRSRSLQPANLEDLANLEHPEDLEGPWDHEGGTATQIFRMMPM